MSQVEFALAQFDHIATLEADKAALYEQMRRAARAVLEGQQRIAALEAENATLKAGNAALCAAMAGNLAANQHGSQPNVAAFPVAKLEAMVLKPGLDLLDALRACAVPIDGLKWREPTPNQKTALFGDPVPSDLPPAPRRPDGTLAPEPKPWAAPRQAGDPRRVGG